MTTRRLREYIERLALFHELVKTHGDRGDAAKVADILSRLREIADDADDLFSRLGDPPTDEGR